jgi:hypothetical protein
MRQESVEKEIPQKYFENLLAVTFLSVGYKYTIM